MAASVLDEEAYVKQLVLIGQQALEVEKEKHNTAEKLKSTRKRKRQLVAEVKFLREKLRSFRRVPELDGPSQVARDLKRREEPQFYEVKVQFADALKRWGQGLDGFIPNENNWPHERDHNL